MELALAVFSALIAVASTATIQVDNGPQQKVQVDTSDSSTASAGPQQPVNVNTNIFNIEGGGCCGNGGKPAQRGQKGNASDTRPGQAPWVMAVGGWTGDRWPDVNVFSLDNERHPVPECLRRRRDYPHNLDGAVGAAVTGAWVPLVCGGYGNDVKSYLASCFHYEVGGDVWRPAGNMSTSRHHASASLVFPATAAASLFITGGFDPASNGHNPSPESTGNGLTFRTDYPIMDPGRSVFQSCQFSLDEDTVVVLGGQNLAKQPSNWLSKLKVGTDTKWKTITTLPTHRYQPICGLIKDKYGGRHILVAGGANSTTSLDSVDIFDLTTKKWRKGNPLPHPLSFAASLPHGDTVISVGGNDGSKFVNSVYVYDVDADSWSLLPETIGRPRSEVAAFYVRKENFPDCN